MRHGGASMGTSDDNTWGTRATDDEEGDKLIEWGGQRAQVSMTLLLRKRRT